MKDFLLNSHSWISYIQNVGINGPCSRAKNGLHNWKSCKKQVRFQKHWLQKLNYLNQKPNADDQISSWQYVIWGTGNHLLFYKLKLSNKCRQPCADLKFKCSLHYLVLILMQFRVLISVEHCGLSAEEKPHKEGFHWFFFPLRSKLCLLSWEDKDSPYPTERGKWKLVFSSLSPFLRRLRVALLAGRRRMPSPLSHFPQYPPPSEWRKCILLWCLLTPLRNSNFPISLKY